MGKKDSFPGDLVESWGSGSLVSMGTCVHPRLIV